MVQAISACPGSIAEILALIEQVRNDEIRVDEVVEAIIDPNEVLLNELGLGHLENAKPDTKKAKPLAMMKIATMKMKTILVATLKPYPLPIWPN